MAVFDDCSNLSSPLTIGLLSFSLTAVSTTVSLGVCCLSLLSVCSVVVVVTGAIVFGGGGLGGVKRGIVMGDA